LEAGKALTGTRQGAAAAAENHRMVAVAARSHHLAVEADSHLPAAAAVAAVGFEWQ
jgi:hypothetical protein